MAIVSVLRAFQALLLGRNYGTPFCVTRCYAGVQLSGFVSSTWKFWAENYIAVHSAWLEALCIFWVWSIRIRSTLGGQNSAVQVTLKHSSSSFKLPKHSGSKKEGLKKKKKNAQQVFWFSVLRSRCCEVMISSSTHFPKILKNSSSRC